MENQAELGEVISSPSTPICPLLSNLAPCIPSTISLTPSSCIQYLEEDVSSIGTAFSMICCMLTHSSSCKEGCTVGISCSLFCSRKSTACGSTRSLNMLLLARYTNAPFLLYRTVMHSTQDVICCTSSFLIFATVRTCIALLARTHPLSSSYLFLFHSFPELPSTTSLSLFTVASSFPPFVHFSLLLHIHPTIYGSVVASRCSQIGTTSHPQRSP